MATSPDTGTAPALAPQFDLGTKIPHSDSPLQMDSETRTQCIKRLDFRIHEAIKISEFMDYVKHF